MALPFSINTTYAAGAQVKSVDLNAIQTSISNEHNKPLHFAAAAFTLQLAPTTVLFDYSGAWKTVAASGLNACTLDLTPYLIPGDVIKEITLRWRNGVTAAAGTCTLSLCRTPIATPFTETVMFASGQNTSTGGANVDRSALIAVAHTVLANTLYAATFEVNATAGNDQVGFGGITVQLGV